MGGSAPNENPSSEQSSSLGNNRIPTPQGDEDGQDFNTRMMGQLRDPRNAGPPIRPPQTQQQNQFGTPNFAAQTQTTGGGMGFGMLPGGVTATGNTNLPQRNQAMLGGRIPTTQPGTSPLGNQQLNPTNPSAFIAPSQNASPLINALSGLRRNYNA